MAKIQERLEACLAGNLSYSELGKFERSALQIHIYFRASALLDLPKDKRKQTGGQLPPDIRDLVRAECKRLVRLRKC